VIFVLRDFHVKLLPAIRIHSWGGFGSQLFALIIADRLSRRTKLRSIRIIFHTSGVTERKLEIPKNWLRKFEIEEIADFHQQSPLKKAVARRGFFQVSRQRFKRFMQMIGITNSSNSEEEFKNIRPWIISVRGHYTQIRLTEDEIHGLMKYFELGMGGLRVNANAIHYRLGDLMKLDEKGIVSPARVLNIWKNHMRDGLPLQIFSDGNRTEFEKVWKSVEGPTNFEFHMLSPIRTIQSCCRVEQFIGTNAKLSLWIAIFRFATKSGPTFIPVEIQHQLRTLLDLQGTENSIYVY